MKFKIFLLFVFLFFVVFRIDAQEINITTTSNSTSWSPVRVTNSGAQLVWVATNSNIGTLTENANDPTFNFGANNGSLISISVTGNNGFTGLSNLRIISGNVQDIDLSNTSALTNLFLTGNNISNINVSNNSSLTRLLLATNSLTSLDIINNTLINDLRINNNNLSSNSLDAIVNNLDSFGISGGKLQISNNNGNLTSSAQPAFDNLIAKGWAIDVGAPPSAPDDQESPSAVTDLSSSNTTLVSTSLSWSPTTDNIAVTDYEVFQDGVTIGLTSGLNSFNVTGLFPSTSYVFTVFAKDAAGNISAVSNGENVTTLDDSEAPAAIVDLISSNTTSTTVDLEWTASSDNIGVTDYEVFQDGVSIGLTGGSTTYNVTGLASTTTFVFTVFAQDATGNTSGISNLASVTTLEVPDTENPTSIGDLTSSNTTITTTDLSWSAASDNVGITDYEVFQNSVSIGLTGGLITFNVSGLSPSSSYDFTVFAKDAAGNSSAVSNTENLITLDDSDPPTAIVDLVASNTMTLTTDLTWSASTDNVVVTDYEVFQDGVSIGLSGGQTSFNVTGLSTNTSYDFTVYAKDEAGNTSFISNTVNITTLSAIDYTSDNSNISTVDWEARDLFAGRNVGIGTKNTQGYRLAVGGNIIAEEIKVELQTNWPDFVFDKDYKLPSLDEIDMYIKANGHLMDIPSSMEVKEFGIRLGEMNAKLLQKIEELTLYTIEQKREIEKLEFKYKTLSLRVENLEKSVKKSMKNTDHNK